MKINRFMIAAPKSGSGKTMITCALLQLLKDSGKNVLSYKCGPDYIDPMFHKKVLGVSSKNLDTFFTDEKKTVQLFLDERADGDFAVLEGVMGLYDGLGGIYEQGSSYHLAKVTQTPIILVVDAKGIWKAWGFGFLADFLAAGVLVILSSAVSLPFHIYAPLSSVGAFLFATVGVVLAGVLIYFFHIRFVWKGILLEEGKKKKIALGMAILTAPYLMYLSPL